MSFPTVRHLHTSINQLVCGTGDDLMLPRRFKMWINVFVRIVNTVMPRFRRPKTCPRHNDWLKQYWKHLCLGELYLRKILENSIPSQYPAE